MKRLLCILAIGTLHGVAAAAQTAPACPGGVVVPDYGYEWEGCPDCLSGRFEGGTWRTVYLAPPSLHKIRADGPAVGKLRENDLLLAVDRLSIVSLAGLTRFQTWTAGATTTLTVRRGNDTVDVALRPLPHCRAAAKSTTATATNAPPISAKVWFGFGLSCGACTAQGGAADTPHWTLPPAVAVVAIEPGGPAEVAGLRVGDTLVTIDGAPLLAGAGGRRLREAAPDRPVAFTVKRNGGMLTLHLRPTTFPNAAPSRADSLPYRATVGGASVEVTGARATVTTDPRTGAVTVRGPGVDVVIRPAPGRP